MSPFCTQVRATCLEQPPGVLKTVGPWHLSNQKIPKTYIEIENSI